LDRIEAAEVNAAKILDLFYNPFKKDLDSAESGMLSMKGVGVTTDLTCPQCSKPLHIKVGKNGPFLACSGYPDCMYSRNYSRDEKGKVHPIESANGEASDKVCDKCGKQMVIKQGKYGEFLACSGYPDCKHTLSLNSKGVAEETGVKCPEKTCDGMIVQKRSKRGKIFYGCSRFPYCTFAVWDKPVPKACPECEASYLVEKTTKKSGTFLTCATEGCGYREASESKE
jgi:DNA topoisomerase-1